MKKDSQSIRSFTKEIRSTNHLSTPYVSNKPRKMAYCTSNQITCCCSPSTIQHPCETNKCQREVRCCDGDETKERDGC